MEVQVWKDGVGWGGAVQGVAGFLEGIRWGAGRGGVAVGKQVWVVGGVVASGGEEGT